MLKLKNRNRFPPGGYYFVEPETGWRSGAMQGFDSCVAEIITHRKAHPDLTKKFSLSTNLNAVMRELEEFTCQRGIRDGWFDRYVVKMPGTIAGAPLPSAPLPMSLEWSWPKCRKCRTPALDLSQVTLWSCIWTKNHALLVKTLEVLRHCACQAKFGKVILFSCLPVKCEFEVVNIPVLDFWGYNEFVNRQVPKHIETDFALSVHEDGFILDPAKWEPGFLDYDYIGAPWPDGVVGNQGFCLESRKMLQEKLKLPELPGGSRLHSDDLICRTFRKRLENMGVKFAPLEVAVRFSTELTHHHVASFGFHGKEGVSKKYDAGWKLIREHHRALVELIYVYVGGRRFHYAANRFVATFKKFPPGADFRLTVVCNGELPDPNLRDRLATLGNPRFLEHDNSGFDIGAFQKAARESDSELLAFFGATTYFQKAGWLARMVEAYRKHGWGIYGAMCNKGNAHYHVWPHVRTTAFWMPRELFLSYPATITQPEQRHPFEHGPHNLTKWVTDAGFKAWSVNWDAEYEEPNWDDHPNGFNRGNQSAVLACDKFCEPPYYPTK